MHFLVTTAIVFVMALSASAQRSLKNRSRKRSAISTGEKQAQTLEIL